MKRRAFFQNLVGSFAVLVGIYSTPISRVREIDLAGVEIMRGEWPDDVKATVAAWEGLLKRGPWPKGMGETIRYDSRPVYPERGVAILHIKSDA